MSWLADFTPGRQPREQNTAPANGKDVDNNPIIKDARGRNVSTKNANKPFLVYQEHLKKQEAEREARKRRNQERLEKMARGEVVGPRENEDLEEEIGLWGLIKFLIFLVAGMMLLGHFITGDYLWDYQGKYRTLKTFWPTGQTLFSESQLAKFDGTKEHFGVYLAIDHDVYDVTSNRRTYGPGGSYAFMSGKDAARAFATGCFKDHQTHDIRGLDEDEQRRLNHWKKFFANHKDYPKVGRVIHRPIDPASPIPADCEPEVKTKRAEAREKSKQEESLPDAKLETKESNSHLEL
ncbi:cytochrome b5 [Ramaria rubella]|nr:cytochrome b5 [Ramaria rubella]